MIDVSHRMARRQTLQGLGMFGLGAALGACQVQRRPFMSVAQAAEPSAVTDEDIFRFALNLEYMETEYYLRGTTGAGMSAADAGPSAGPVTGGRKVPFANQAFREFAEELAENELGHVRFYRRTLGSGAVDRPAIDFNSGFAKVAQAAGLGPDFDPFANEMNFFLGGMLFEDVGVTAYKGAAPLLRDKDHLAAAAGILAVEAYHMGMARSQLYEMGRQAQDAANAISDARDRLDGPEDLDQGIRVNGRANFVPSDPNGIAFSRTPQQVLRIVYLTSQPGVSAGGFYPQGFNGAIRTT